MKLLDFMNEYNRYGKVDIPNICEQCINLTRENISHERKEENKMERHIKIIIKETIREDQYNTREGRVQYKLEIVSNQDTVIFTDYFVLGDKNVLAYLSDNIATILDVYSFNDYIALLKSYGITHKIEKMLSEEEIRANYEELREQLFRVDPISHDYLYIQGWVKALEYVLGVDNE